MTYDLKNWSGPSLLQGALRLYASYLGHRVSGANAVILLFLGSFLSCFCFALRYQLYTIPLPDWPKRQKQNHSNPFRQCCWHSTRQYNIDSSDSRTFPLAFAVFACFGPVSTNCTTMDAWLIWTRNYTHHNLYKPPIAATCLPLALVLEASSWFFASPSLPCVYLISLTVVSAWCLRRICLLESWLLMRTFTYTRARTY